MIMTVVTVIITNKGIITIMCKVYNGTVVRLTLHVYTMTGYESMRSIRALFEESVPAVL